jgi:hypothetical protein
VSFSSFSSLLSCVEFAGEGFDSLTSYEQEANAIVLKVIANVIFKILFFLFLV